MAKLALGAAYTGSYLADSSDTPPHTNAIKVFRTRLRTRLDITENGGRVLIQVDPTGTYTCNLPTTGLASCLTLAGANEAVPSNLDPGGQRLFTTTLSVLAAGTGLKVAAAAPRPAVNGIAIARCYALIAAPAGAAPGTYCFTATGILARAQFRSNVLQLTALGGTPVDSDFTLPVAPLAAELGSRVVRPSLVGARIGWSRIASRLGVRRFFFVIMRKVGSPRHPRYQLCA